MNRNTLLVLVACWLGTTFFACERVGLLPVLSGENFLENSGVEEGSDLPLAWSFSSGDSMAIRRNFWASPGCESSRSLMINREVYSIEHEFWSQTQVGRLPNNRELVLRAKIKTVGMAGQGVALVIRGDVTEKPRGEGEFLVTTQGTTEIITVPDWTEYEIRLPEGEARSIRSVTAYVSLLPETTGTVYFDEIKLGFIE